MFIGGWMMRLMIACGAISASIGPVSAIELARKGDVIQLSGLIRNGDEFILRDFLAQPESRSIKTIMLSSPGGRLMPARAMARLIRNQGMTTVVDASRHACDSACTGLFAAGLRRHYLNASGISDGEQRRGTGLGFHEGNSMQANGRRGYSGAATAEMVNIYYEMGVPGAASVATKSTFNRIYRISGQTALSLGIATSLSAP